MVHMLTVVDDDTEKQQISKPHQALGGQIEYSLPTTQQGITLATMHADRDSQYTFDAFNHAMIADYSPEPCTAMDAESSEFPSGNFHNVSSMTRVEKQPDPMELLFGQPKFHRQYSISTVLEVIDNHTLGADNQNNSNNSCTPNALSQPIDINRGAQMDYEQYRATPTDCRISNAQPSSDLTFLGPNSPMTLPFGHYKNLPDTPQSSNFDMQSNPANSYTDNVAAVGSFGSTGDANSAFQTTCQGIQETKNPASIPQLSNGQWLSSMPLHFGSAPQYESVPVVPQHQHTKLSNVSSCPDFDTSNDVFDATAQFQPSAHYGGRTMSSSSTQSDFPVSGTGLELQEIDQDALDYDVFNQLHKADRRRIRNNLACKASRHRRKQRKLHNEQQAADLESKNQALRERIRQLETDVRLTRDTVLRRMSET